MSSVEGLSFTVRDGRLDLHDLAARLVPGFTVACNASNVRGYVLSTAVVTVLRKSQVKLNQKQSHFALHYRW